MKKLYAVGLCALLLALSGCYQMNTSDDLRTVPVTNNPNIIPSQGGRLPSAPI